MTFHAVAVLVRKTAGSLSAALADTLFFHDFYAKRGYTDVAEWHRDLLWQLASNAERYE